MMVIRRYRHGEGDLWQRLGPHLVDSKVRQALGGPISSDPDTTWWLALDGDDAVGFAAARMTKGGTCQLRHAYVVPGARGHGIYRALCAARLDACQERCARSAVATVNDTNLGHYLDLGFVVTGKRGRYTTVAKELS